jgi:hypothetical protein
MKVAFGGVPVTSLSNNYHYKNYIETSLNYNSDVKASWLNTQGYATDTHDAMDTMGSGNE